ncbi:phosphonopyruvate decarboxylase, partial [Candidatus Marinimicrobia bacterium MT.SAG.4]
MSISPLEFYNAIAENDIDFVAGVPDSLLKELCACIDDKFPKDRHIIAANEGNAIAMAVGYHLATGKIPLVYMQNSGLGNAINPLLSLSDPEIYSIPMIVIIGWRGEPGTPDAIQHVKDGRIQLDLLKVLELPYEIISKNDENIKEIMHHAVTRASKESRPIILLIRKGVFSQYNNNSPKKETQLMKREEALIIILESLNENSVIVATTGKTSREIYEIRDMLNQSHQSSFLTVGSMGHCSSIALGISLARPDR